VEVLEPDPAYAGQRGRPTGETIGGGEVVASAGAAMAITSRLAMGVAGKVVHVGLAGESDAGVAADVGASAGLLGGRLRIGAALQNLGPAMGPGLPSPLPRTIRAGAAIELGAAGPGIRTTLAAEALHLEGRASFATGLELGYRDERGRGFLARAGFDARARERDAASPVAVGGGVMLGGLRVDYAYRAVGPLGGEVGGADPLLEGVVGTALGAGGGEARLALLGSLLSLAGLIVLGPLLVAPLARYGGRLLALAFPREGAIAQGNLLRNPGRAAITASAMLISLAILVALAGLASSFTRGLLGYLEQSMRADYLLVPEALFLGRGDGGAGPELAERLRATPGVSAVTTLRQTSGRINGNEAQLIGIDPQTYPELAGLVFTAGEPVAAYRRLAEGGAVIVNGVLAAQAGLAPGDVVTLETPGGPRRYEVVGVGIDYLNSRVATAYFSQADLAAALGPQNDALLMANRAPDADPAALEAALLALTRDYPTFSLVSFAQWREEQLAGNQARTNILYALMAALAAPSLIALANTLGINVLERTRELAVLRAIGATRGQVQRLIVAESLLLASLGVLGGALAGVGLGYALVGAINRSGLNFPYSFPASGIVLAALVGLAFGVLAALLPARRAARLDIIAALRWE